jgi:2-methylcitrate dehydratase
MIRFLDFNEGYLSNGSGKPSDTISALLAAAEIARASGSELMLATVLAYEIYGRFCDAWDNKASGIDHATIGGIASVIGAARLLGLTNQQTIEAINLSTAPNVAINQTRMGNISQWKSCAGPNAGRNAIFATQLAARGMTGPNPVFEGRHGFCNVVSDQAIELGPFGSDDNPFRIMRGSVKKFPLSQYAQTIVTAALEARTLIAHVSDIEAVDVRVSQKVMNLLVDDRERWNPRNRETADHSEPYNAGVALMYGGVDQSHFTEQHFLHNKPLLDLVNRIRFSTSEEANQRDAEIKLCEMDLIMRSGDRKSVRVEFQHGDWRNPMTDAEMEAKFRSLVNDMLPRGTVDALVKRLWTLEQLPDVGALIEMTKV